MHASIEVADKDVAFIRRFSRRKCIPKVGGRDALIDLARSTLMDARPGRKQAHMFIGGASKGTAARMEGTQRGRGGTNTWEEAGPRIPGQSCGARIQNCDHEHEVKDSFERE